MSEKLNELGVPPDFHRHAQHFATIFRGLGMTSSQVEAAIAWGAGFDGRPEDLLPQFDSFCARQGIARDLADLGVAWHAQICDHGIDTVPARQTGVFSERDAQRLTEIEEEMRKPRAASAYWQQASVRDEYLALLQKAEQSAPTDSLLSSDAERKVEIERVMRHDRRLYETAGLDREYLAILERENGESASAPPHEPTIQSSPIEEIP